MIEKDIDSFDNFAKNYRKIHDDNIKLSGADSKYFAEHKVIEVRKKEMNNGFMNILDLGCGDGISATYFNKHFSHYHYSGIDISKESIKEAQSKQIPNAAFSIYDGLSIPSPDEHFDIVFIACVLHHVMPDHRMQLLIEIKRVLKNAGRIYIFEHNPYNPITQKMVKNCLFDRNAILIKPEHSKKLLKKVGFKQINLSFILFFPRIIGFNNILGLEKYLTWLPLGGQYFIRAIKDE